MFKETNVKRARGERKWKSRRSIDLGDRNGIRTHFPHFVILRDFRHERAADNALEGKCKSGSLYGIAQNYAVRVSEIVQKGPLG